MKRGTVLAGILALCIGAPTAYFFTRPTDDQIFANACADVIKDRLRSPSSFRLLKMTVPTALKPSLAEYMGWQNTKEQMDEMDSVTQDAKRRELYLKKQDIYNSGDPLMLRAFIEYDAQNAYGTAIRDLAECTYIYFDADDPLAQISVMGPRINGDSSLDWSVKQVLAGGD